jgi:hypothetical protein
MVEIGDNVALNAEAVGFYDPVERRIARSMRGEVIGRTTVPGLVVVAWDAPYLPQNERFTGGMRAVCVHESNLMVVEEEE